MSERTIEFRLRQQSAYREAVIREIEKEAATKSNKNRKKTYGKRSEFKELVESHGENKALEIFANKNKDLYGDYNEAMSIAKKWLNPKSEISK